MQQRYQLHEVTEQLAAVACGRQPAEVVIRDCHLVNVNTAEIIAGIDVAITHGRIALVGDAVHTVGAETRVIDAHGLYLAPGLMDGHVHVESSLLTLSEYARAVVPHGTTAIFMDPHEIANVLGMEGVRLMVDEGRQLPLRVYTTIPSCVPAVPGLEDNGATIGLAEIEAALAWPEVVGLGEMMNYPGVVYGDAQVHRLLAATLAAQKTITGHYPVCETGLGLNAYTASGVHCCHESTSKEEALAKMRLGMYAQLREGSAWHDLHETIKAITETGVDTRFANLVSDDAHPLTLQEIGHLDHLLRRAVAEGLDAIAAISMVTINVAECFGLSRDLGSVSPGKWADLVLLSDLESLEVVAVLQNGELVAEHGKLVREIPQYLYPAAARDTVHLVSSLMPIDFAICPPSTDATAAIVRVMQVSGAKVGTMARQAVLPVVDGFVQPIPAQEIAKVAVLERHTGSGSAALGFVHGFGLRAGAVASTVSHDSHNLLIIGTNDDDMALAGNLLLEAQGGMVAVRDGAVLAFLPLPIAGLISDQPLAQVVAWVRQLEEAWRQLGCQLVSPFMTMSLLALPVLPELRLTNRGLVDTANFQLVDLIIAERFGQVVFDR